MTEQLWNTEDESVRVSGLAEKIREMAPPLSAVQNVKVESREMTNLEFEFNFAEMAAPFPLPDVFVMRAT